MKTQVRILLALAAAALLAGWLGLRGGNAALEARLRGDRSSLAGRAQAQPDEAGPAPQGAPTNERGFAASTGLERAGDRGAQPRRAAQQEVSR